MSHEIRTPMNGVLGMLGLVLDTDLSKNQRAYLSLARTSADALLVVINDILDSSKIEAGRLDLVEEPFAIRSVIEQTVKLLRIRADEKNISLTHAIAPDVPAWVVGDEGRVRQVLVNLLGNAVKFTDHGGVDLHVSVQEAGDDRMVLRALVRDTGIGIPASKMRLIFQPFSQADGSTSRRYGGTGLGLSISRRLVELMGGRLEVESEVGKGSAFQFTV